MSTLRQMLVVLCFLCFLCFPTLACNGNSPSQLEQDSGSNDGLADGSVEPDNLGSSCAGGCIGAELCTVADEDCATSHCLVDRRDGNAVNYCTADCSTSACPSGFTCTDVPFFLERACVRSADGTFATGSMVLEGSLGPNGTTAAPFTTTGELDTLASTDSLPCNAVAIVRAAPDSTIRLQTHLCGAVGAYVTIVVPATVGPASGAAVFALMGSSSSNNIARYGDASTPAPDIEAEVVSLSFDEPNTISHLNLVLHGSLDHDDDCPGPGCGVAGAKLNISASIELNDAALR